MQEASQKTLKQKGNNSRWLTCTNTVTRAKVRALGLLNTAINQPYKTTKCAASSPSRTSAPIPCLHRNSLRICSKRLQQETRRLTEVIERAGIHVN